MGVGGGTTGSTLLTTVIGVESGPALDSGSAGLSGGNCDDMVTLRDFFVIYLATWCGGADNFDSAIRRGQFSDKVTSREMCRAALLYADVGLSAFSSENADAQHLQ